MNQPYRLAYLVTHPIQYQAPLLRHLSAHPAIDLTVFFLSDISTRDYHDPGFKLRLRWDVPLLEGYKHVFLPCVGRSDRLSWLRPLTHSLARHLRSGRYEVLWVHGYAHHALLRAIGAARRLGIKVLLRGESNLLREETLLARLRLTAVSHLFKEVDGFLAIGTLNRDYYLKHGVSDDRIFMMPYAVDNEFFRSRSKVTRPEREQLRAQLGIAPHRPVILYVGKLLAKKRPKDLLDAYSRLSPDGRREPLPCLLFVGDGDQRPMLEAKADELAWSSVKFVGFKNQAELPRYYDLCDVFVLPSAREPWGLVVNEAMNAGKAIIVSDRVGAAPDLVIDGDNGFIVGVGDVRLLADRLRELSCSPDLALRMGERSRERIAHSDFNADAEGLLEALEFATGRTCLAPTAADAARSMGNGCRRDVRIGDR